MKKIPSAFSLVIRNAINRLKIHSHTTFKFRGEEFCISECIDFQTSYWILTIGGQKLWPRARSSRLYELQEDAIRLSIIELTMSE